MQAYEATMSHKAKETLMTISNTYGPAISLDHAFDNGMDDESEVIIYQSERDRDGYLHVILMTVWRNGALTAHNFEYAVDEDHCRETLESATSAVSLVGELPELFREEARIAVSNWCGNSGTSTPGQRS